jgi:hypothetical protein
VTLPDPLAADAVVTVDPALRTLYVRPADAAGPFVHRLWAQGHRALSRIRVIGVAMCGLCGRVVFVVGRCPVAAWRFNFAVATRLIRSWWARLVWRRISAWIGRPAGF